LRRILSTRNHFRLINQNPVAGVGVGDYRRELQSAYDRDAAEGLNLEANAHNYFLFIWAGAGIIALGYFLLLLAVLLSAIRKMADGWLQLLALSVWIFFVCILMFDIFINYQTGATVFILSGCLILESTKSGS
jgi:O-antigen ligase